MNIDSMEAFLRYFEGIRGRTRRVAECIPPAAIEWRHRDGAFSLGDVVRHIAATERFMFTENVAGRPSRYPGHAEQLAGGYQAVLQYLDRMHAEAVAILRTLGDTALETRVTTPAGVEMRAWKWLRAMVEHEVHHRGQLYLMLGMLDVATPPLYGLTSEEVFERSEHPEG